MNFLSATLALLGVGASGNEADCAMGSALAVVVETAVEIVVEEALGALVSLPALRGASLSRGFSAMAEEMARKMTMTKSKRTVCKQNLLRSDYRESNCQTGRGGEHRLDGAVRDTTLWCKLSAKALRS
jgi:hypothetical protein